MSRLSHRGDVNKLDEKHEHMDQNQIADGYLSFERWLNSKDDSMDHFEHPSENREVQSPPLLSYYAPPHISTLETQLLLDNGVQSPPLNAEINIRDVYEETSNKCKVNLASSAGRNLAFSDINHSKDASSVDYVGGHFHIFEKDRYSPGKLADDALRDHTDDGLEAYMTWLVNQTDDSSCHQHVSVENSIGSTTSPPRSSSSKITPHLHPPAESPIPNVRHPRELASTPYQPISPFGRSPSGSHSRSRNSLWKLMAKE